MEKFDFFNLTSYIELCINLGIDINYNETFSALSKFYDKATNLFFIDSADDLMSDKIMATAIVKRVLGDQLSNGPFMPEAGIRTAYLASEFTFENGSTLYSSGGDILYCMSIFEMNEEINKENLNSWYAFWRDSYQSVPVNCLANALHYSEFVNIAKIFEPSYTSAKLPDYYLALTRADIDNISDINVLYNVIKHVNLSINQEAIKAIIRRIEETIANDSLFHTHIDLKSTVHGLLLSQKTGFTINEEKLRGFIRQNYLDIPLIQDTYSKASALYYNLILDQLMNGYDLEYDRVYFQAQVDNILRTLAYNQSLAADVITARRMVEIIMDLQIFDVDIRLTSSQRNKILAGLKRFLEDDTLRNSVLINDVFLVDQALSLNLVSEDEFVWIYNRLKSDGGVSALDRGEIVPDVLTTYQFMVSLGRLNNFDDLISHKAFVDSLFIKDGLYKPAENRDVIDELAVITYSNAIRHLEIGGDKVDPFK